MRRTSILIFGALLLCSIASAQQLQTGSIEGTVTLEDGSPLPGVSVTAVSEAMPKARATVTGADGLYRFVAMPPGDYEVTFTLAGFATEKRTFPVYLQQKSIINLAMKDATFEEEIMVTAETPTIDTTSAELKAAVPEEVIKSLPMGQQYRDLIKLIPGVQYTEDSVRGPSAGGNGQDNVYEFDGVGVNLPLYGTLAPQPSAQDVEEMAIVKGGANAVGFNRSGGFLVNTLSKSGTNLFHGELSYQLQTAGMTGSVTDESAQEFDEDLDWLTANIGGPIIRDNLFFYASYYRPTATRGNRANVYGNSPDYENIRDEYFAKLTWTPTNSLLFSGSYRDSTTDVSGGSVGQFEAGTTSAGSDSELKIAVAEASWVISDSGVLTFKASDFKNPGSSTPDNILDFQIAEGVPLDINNLDQQGYFIVPGYIEGEDEFNAWVTPLIEQYGYLDNGVQTGGGSVGVYPDFDADDFYSKSFQAGYDHFIGNHELHIGYRWEKGEEVLNRTSNGWGRIYVTGGIDEDYGEDVFYRGQFYQQTLGDKVPPIHSEIKTQTIELNDVWRLNDWTFNIGLLASNDTLYGQGLTENSSNVSGFELCTTCMYEMKDVGWDEMISPRLAATWSPNGKDAAYVSYARYYPAATSLPRAASWGRNLQREINASFDADGNFLRLDDLRASSGKFFQEGIDPRHIDEYLIGYDMQISNSWTGRVHARHRKATDFWEDTWNWDRIEEEAPSPIPREPYIPDDVLDAYRDEVGGSSYVIAQLDDAFTKYYEVSTEAEYRGENVFFRGSYVWSHYYGNFDQDNTSVSNDGNIYIGSSYLADGTGRQTWQNRYGNLRGDRRHQLKLYGYYQLPWNGVIGAYGIYQSGQPWETWGPSEYYSGTFFRSRYAEPAGSRTTDAHHQLDLSYTQNIPLGDRFNIMLRGEVFNVYDNQTGYNIAPELNDAGYGEPREFFDPRRFQLTAAFQF
jgi:hypothetical protein